MLKMITRKTIGGAVLAASLGLAATAAFAWPGCGGAPMNYGPGCAYAQGVGPQNGYPCWASQRQFRGAPGFNKQGFQQRKIYLRGALDLNDAQKPAFEAYYGAIDTYHNLQRPQIVQGATRQDVLNARLAFQKARTDALQKAIDARQALVKVLTPEQVKTLDAVESRTHAAGPKFGPGFHGPHHGFRNGQPVPAPQVAPAPAPQTKGGAL